MFYTRSDVVSEDTLCSLGVVKFTSFPPPLSGFTARRIVLKTLEKGRIHWGEVFVYLSLLEIG